MQKFVGARRRYAQRAGDKLRVEKQRQLIKIFDARCVQSLFYLQLILEIPEKKLAFRRSLCQGASGSRRRVQRRGIFVLGKTFSRRNTFRISRKNDVAQREKARCLARWRLSDTPQAKHSCSPCFPKRGAPSDCCSSRTAFWLICVATSSAIIKVTTMWYTKMYFYGRKSSDVSGTGRKRNHADAGTHQRELGTLR